MLTPKKILVPTDFSAHSDKALKQALDIARGYGSKVFLLHVINEKIRDIREEYKYASITVQTVDRIHKKLRLSAERSMAKQVEKFSQNNEVELVTLIEDGGVVEEILRVQKEEGIDLIVIASLGRSALSRYLIGGVARKVLWNATCPVLLTK